MHPIITLLASEPGTRQYAEQLAAGRSIFTGLIIAGAFVGVMWIRSRIVARAETQEPPGPVPSQPDGQMADYDL